MFKRPNLKYEISPCALLDVVRVNTFKLLGVGFIHRVRKNGNDDVKLMSSMRSVVVTTIFILFSVILNVKMNCAINYEHLFNFDKVMPKMPVVPFFRTRCIDHTLFS